MENECFTVSQINSYINKKLKFDNKLKNVYVKGEISNFKTYPSGHSYFTLKDEKSQIPVVMFKGRKRNLKFQPENGMKVIVNLHHHRRRYQADPPYRRYDALRQLRRHIACIQPVPDGDAARRCQPERHQPGR